MFLSLWIVGRSTKGLRFRKTTLRGGWPPFNCYSWYASVPRRGGMTLCTEIKKGRVKSNKYFRCERRDYRKKLSFYNGTFFKKLNLSLKDVFCSSSNWEKHQRLTYEDIAVEIVRETGSKLSFHTSWDYMKYFRDICTEHFRKHPLRIGSPGKVAEIYETLLTRRKYNRGRVVEKHWCFGRTEWGTNECCVTRVERRAVATLLPLIRQYVVPETTIPVGRIQHCQRNPGGVSAWDC